MDERIVVAKPIACRPTCSTFRFSEILAGGINDSPTDASSQAAAIAIRPKTVRVKPVGIHAHVEAEIPGTAVHYLSDKDLDLDRKRTVVYKPLAKLVSKATVSLLANLENSYVNHQPSLPQVEACFSPANQVYHHLKSDISSNHNWNNPLVSATDHPNKASENLKESKKPLAPTSSMDRPSYDGYNWKKYGQKQVKGSEYPRSYYKCTHPNCPVKKKVERSLDGQIAETVYRGEHIHLKPQPPKRNTTGGKGQGLGFDCQDSNEDSEAGSRSVGALGGSIGSPGDSCDLSGECEEDIKGVEAAVREPKSKRRKNEYQSNEAGPSEQGLQEPYFVVQSSTDSEIIGDGFRWRKYGQKVVKGNPYPRSYYRCTGLKCNVRKHVERSSDDPRTFITTYEGKHNHDMPIKNKNPVASASDSRATHD